MKATSQLALKRRTPRRRDRKAAELILRREVRRVTAELENAREVLRHVEWLPGDLRPDEPRWCMICMSYEPHHAPDCALNAALAAKGE